MLETPISFYGLVAKRHRPYQLNNAKLDLQATIIGCMFSQLSHKMRFQNFRIKCNGIRKLLKCCFTLIGIKAVDAFWQEYSCIENNNYLMIDKRKRHLNIPNHIIKKSEKYFWKIIIKMLSSTLQCDYYTSINVLLGLVEVFQS